MNILLHICCGPCGIAVIERLLDAGHDVTGFFFNPNIHPLAEYMRRREGAGIVAKRLGIPLVYADTLGFEEQHWDRGYTTPGINAPGGQETDFAPGMPGALLPPAANPAKWLRMVAGKEAGRCAFCWESRIAFTAAFAKARQFEGISSTLLYSRYQKHEAIRDLGYRYAQTHGLSFVYEDFRSLWNHGIQRSKEWGIYRQPYCGCLYSEYDRYSKPFAATLNTRSSEQ